MTLFRKESLHNQRRAWLGSIQLVQPVGLAWLTFWVLATLAVVSTFLFWGEYTRKAHLTGVLVPDRGLIRIAAPVAGTVLALNAREGQAVREGDPLFTLNVQSPMLAGPAQAELQQTFRSRLRSLDEAALQARALLLQRQTALARRMADIAARARSARRPGGAGGGARGLAEESLARLESLRAEKFVSPAQVQAKSEELLGLQAQVQALERQRGPAARWPRWRRAPRTAAAGDARRRARSSATAPSWREAGAESRRTAQPRGAAPRRTVWSAA
jgi:membrane fusion protein